MSRCCVCGREAKHIVHGLWWCEEHVDCTSGNQNKPKNPKEENKVRKVDLGLAWV